MHKILLIEDAVEYTLQVQKTLGSRYQIQIAPTAAVARNFLANESFDLILLDVLLPDGNGFEICSELRTQLAENCPPIIFLSGKADQNDRVMGWTLGADDYITKPFSPLEFQARIQNRLERYRSQKDRENIIRWSEITVNLSFHEVSIQENGQERKLQLTPIEFKLLHCLMKNHDRVLSRAQLIHSAWGDMVHVSERTVDKHISILRHKLNSDKTVIKTISGLGYRLVKHEDANR